MQADAVSAERSLRSPPARLRCLSSLALLALIASQLACAQELAPRAYVITPQGTNAITITGSFFKGGLILPGEIPLTDGKGTFNVPVITYYRSFSFLGRSANVAGGLPYGIGNFQGTMEGGTVQQAYRSGLRGPAIRFAVNLKGGPAMGLPEFRKWNQRLLLGSSLIVVLPASQYDPAKLINWGINRWGFKPELGVSQRWGTWMLDSYAGAWFFTTNSQSFSIPLPKSQTLTPIASFEGHLSHDVGQRLWFSLDGNFWTGGTACVEGIPKPDTRQTSARIGLTASIPVNLRQSFKVSYSRGAYARFGTNYQNLSVAWQYGWIGKLK